MGIKRAAAGLIRGSSGAGSSAALDGDVGGAFSHSSPHHASLLAFDEVQVSRWACMRVRVGAALAPRTLRCMSQA